MQNASIVALLGLLLLGSASLPAAAAPGRLLRETGAGNTNDCAQAIPGCEPDRCSNRIINGKQSWACLRCSGGFTAVLTGEDITACVCPSGSSYTPAASEGEPASCVRCMEGEICPGGSGNDNLGPQSSCGPSLTTRTGGSSTINQCVAVAGYARVRSGSSFTAVACVPGTYAPANNRLPQCIRCQGGLVEDADEGLGDGKRISKLAVCRVPPGHFLDANLVKICPKGFFRGGYALHTDQAAQRCTACPEGTTTGNAGQASADDCNVPMPGWGFPGVNGAELGPADTNLAPSVCPYGTYSDPDNTKRCVPCKAGTTRQTGSTSENECVVPPGYFLNADAKLERCSGNTYRAGWVAYDDKAASSCTSCGEGISARPSDADESPEAGEKDEVQATRDSCYVPAGWSMMPARNGAFVGRECPVNSYGSSSEANGLRLVPCKPCPRNMITLQPASTEASDCINPDGFGYASDGASKCAPGFWATQGSLKTCTRCPFGRTTAKGSSQNAATTCVVAPGFGAVGSAADEESQAALPVAQCAAGTYSPGGKLDSQCVSCGEGTSSEPGSADAADCNVCEPGFGMYNDDKTCSPCDFGDYQVGGGDKCLECPVSYFYSPLGGEGDVVKSEGVTLQISSKSLAQCVPTVSQMASDAGQAWLPAGLAKQFLNASGTSSIYECIELASSSPGALVFLQYDGATCFHGWMTPVAADSKEAFHFKLPAAGDASVSGLRARSMSSGLYASSAPAEGTVIESLNVAGSNLDASTASRFLSLRAGEGVEWDAGASVPACRTKCDTSASCVGFVFVDGKGCAYKGGVDAPRTRAFMVLPEVSKFSGEWGQP